MRSKSIVFASLIAALALLSAAGPASRAAAQQPAPWLPQIAVVWPTDGQHGMASVEQSRAVNVSVWPTGQVRCDETPAIPLLRAWINEPAVDVGTGRAALRTGDGRLTDPIKGRQGAVFPTLEYNDVPADVAAAPTTAYRFFTKWWSDRWSRPQPPGRFPGFLPPAGPPSNVWVHAADPRTIYPKPVVPTGFGEAAPKHVDPRIQVVWSHDDQGNAAPVDRATRLNIAVDIFAHATLSSAPLDYPPGGPAGTAAGPVTLYIAEENAPLTQFTRAGGPPVADYAQRLTYTANGQTFPRWVFNDVPVKPGTPYHFLVLVFGVENSPTVWTHAKDARTFLPAPAVPPACQE